MSGALKDLFRKEQERVFPVIARCLIRDNYPRIRPHGVGQSSKYRWRGSLRLHESRKQLVALSLLLVQARSSAEHGTFGRGAWDVRAERAQLAWRGMRRQVVPTPLRDPTQTQKAPSSWG